MNVLNLSAIAKNTSIFNETNPFADMRTWVEKRPVVRNAHLVVFSQRVRFFADMRTTSPLRGDALSAIPPAVGYVRRSARIPRTIISTANGAAGEPP
jgi:hypothetical protein